MKIVKSFSGCLFPDSARLNTGPMTRLNTNTKIPTAGTTFLYCF